MISVWCSAIRKLMQAISDNLPEQFSHFSFTPILCGSMAEGTKCYQPDEFDFICKIHSRSMNPAGSGLRSSDARFADLTEDNGYIKVVKFAGSFYAAVDLAINRLCLTYNSGYLEICPHSLLIEDKISRLRLMWNGAFFQRMVNEYGNYLLSTLVVQNNRQAKPFIAHKPR